MHTPRHHPRPGRTPSRVTRRPDPLCPAHRDPFTPGGLCLCRCDLAPKGWWCSRAVLHDGPCALHPTRSTRLRIWLRRRGR